MAIPTIAPAIPKPTNRLYVAWHSAELVVLRNLRIRPSPTAIANTARTPIETPYSVWMEAKRRAEGRSPSLGWRAPRKSTSSQKPGTRARAMVAGGLARRAPKACCTTLSTRWASFGVTAWLRTPAPWAKAKKTPAAASATAMCHQAGTTKPSRRAEAPTLRRMNTPTPANPRIRKGTSWKIRSPTLRGGWAWIAASTSVNRTTVMLKPKKITASDSARAWTGFSGSIGMTRAKRTRTGWASRAAAANPVTIVPTSRPSLAGPFRFSAKTVAPDSSSAPSRKIVPATKPVRMPVARRDQDLPTAALATTIKGSGSRRSTAPLAASRIKCAVSLLLTLSRNRLRRRLGGLIREVHQRTEQLYRQRQDHGRVLFGADLDHGLQEAQLERALL